MILENGEFLNRHMCITSVWLAHLLLEVLRQTAHCHKKVLFDQYVTYKTNMSSEPVCRRFEAKRLEHLCSTCESNRSALARFSAHIPHFCHLNSFVDSMDSNAINNFGHISQRLRTKCTRNQNIKLDFCRKQMFTN